MESLYEKIIDWGLLVLKAFVVLAVLRAITIIMDIPINIPIIDDVLFTLYGIVTGDITRFR